MTRERFLLKTVGGPHPGSRILNTDESRVWTWPLPVVIEGEGGRYVKESESELPPQEPDSAVVRGAQYRWKPYEEES